jgi:hypothetical protein
MKVVLKMSDSDQKQLNLIALNRAQLHLIAPNRAKKKKK